MERRDERKAVYERTFGFPLDAYTKIKQRKAESMILFTVFSNILKINFQRIIYFVFLLHKSSPFYMQTVDTAFVCFEVFSLVCLYITEWAFLKTVVYTLRTVRGCHEKMGNDIIKPCCFRIVGHLIIKQISFLHMWSLCRIKVGISAFNVLGFVFPKWNIINNSNKIVQILKIYLKKLNCIVQFLMPV